MSSHHIVRDDQEPALIIANGAACTRELMDQLLEWSPLVVVLDSAIERVLELGIKVDVLLGDFDRDFPADDFKLKQFPLEVVHTPDQNKSDLEKAFDYLIERKIPAVNVIWATGKRMDHTFANIANLARYREKLKIVLIDDHSKIYLLPRKFQKWFPKDTIISLLPLAKVGDISTKNLFYELDKGTLELGHAMGNSNHVTSDGIVEIMHSTGDLLIMECWD